MLSVINHNFCLLYRWTVFLVAIGAIPHPDAWLETFNGSSGSLCDGRVGFTRCTRVTRWFMRAISSIEVLLLAHFIYFGNFLNVLNFLLGKSSSYQFTGTRGRLISTLAGFENHQTYTPCWRARQLIVGLRKNLAKSWENAPPLIPSYVNAHSLLLTLLACAGRRARRSLGRTAHAEWRRTLSITCVIT